MPDEQQPSAEQQPVAITDEQLSKLAQDSGAAAGKAAADALAAGVADSQDAVTVEFPSEMTVTLTDSQWQALTSQLDEWQDTQAAHARLQSTTSLFSLLLCAVILGAVLVPMLLDRWRS